MQQEPAFPLPIRSACASAATVPRLPARALDSEPASIQVLPDARSLATLSAAQVPPQDCEMRAA